MDILFLVLYASFPELAVLGYWGFLGERGRKASEHFGVLLLIAFVAAAILTLVPLLYLSLQAR